MIKLIVTDVDGTLLDNDMFFKILVNVQRLCHLKVPVLFSENVTP